MNSRVDLLKEITRLRSENDELKRKVHESDKVLSDDALQLMDRDATIEALKKRVRELEEERKVLPEKDTALYLLGNSLAKRLSDNDWKGIEPFLKAAEMAWREMQTENAEYHRRLCIVTDERDQAHYAALSAKREGIILTGKEIKALAEFVGLEIAEHHKIDEEITEAEIAVSEREGEGRTYKIAHFYDYPEEGCIDLNDF